MTTPPPPHSIAPPPRVRKAQIHTHNGWWFRYVVHRTEGFFNPERSTSLHRTLEGARRAKRRWEASTTFTPEIVE